MSANVGVKNIHCTSAIDNIKWLDDTWKSPIRKIIMFAEQLWQLIMNKSNV